MPRKDCRLRATLVAAVPIAALLSGCGEPRVNKPVETRAFVLERVDPPKHMHVDLRDAATGEVHRRVYVDKRCPGHAAHAKVGQTYRLTTFAWTQGERSGRGFNGLAAAFCGR